MPISARAFLLNVSSLTNPILAAVWTFAVYVTGHLAWSLQILKDKVPEGTARIACSRLNPDLVEHLLVLQLAVGDAVERDAP